MEASASVERFVDRLLRNVRSTTEDGTPKETSAPRCGVDGLISRVLAHAAKSSSSAADVPFSSTPLEALQVGESGQSASLLSSPWPSSLDISGREAMSPIPFRPELNSSQDMEVSESSTSKPFRFGDVSTLSLPSDGSKEHEETRLPEEVQRKELIKEEAPFIEAEDHDRHLQEMQVTLRDLKKQLEEETQEKQSLHHALAEALAALAESEKAAENAQQGNATQVEQVVVQHVVVAETEDVTQDSVKTKTEGGIGNTLQVSQSESSIGTGVLSESMHVGKANQSLEHVSQVSVQTQADLSPSHAERQPMEVEPESPQLEELERRLEETQRQLEACLQAAAKSPDEAAKLDPPIGHGHDRHAPFSEVSSTAIALDEKLMACLDLRYLGDLDPPEVLLKAAMGQLYAILCLQTKAKSFLAAEQLHELRAKRPMPRQRAHRPASAMTCKASRQGVQRNSLPQALPRGRHDELDEDASTARRRWSDHQKVPPLALGQLNQFNERRSPSTADTRTLDTEVFDKKPPEVVVPCGSAISAVRGAAKPKACRPSSSPGAFAQKRSDNPPAKQLRRAMSAGGAASRTREQSACRSRPQSHFRKSQRGNEGYIPQAELWLIKNRALASMMWPPLSEAARGRRPKTKTACVRCLPDPPQVQGCEASGCCA